MVENITVLINSERHPINPWINKWITERPPYQKVDLVRSASAAVGGDLLFLVSCTEIVSEAVRQNFTHTLVIHASDLPEGRGWSPHIWDILNGEDEIVVCLLAATDKVDRGDIWHKLRFKIPKHYLYNDIIGVVNGAHLELIDFAIQNYKTIVPTPQSKNIEPTYYPRRTPLDSMVSPNRTILELFDELRVCDAERFPAFFEIDGARFKISIEHYDDD